jgi:hypothetical protein
VTGSVSEKTAKMLPKIAQHWAHSGNYFALNKQFDIFN